MHKCLMNNLGHKNYIYYLIFYSYSNNVIEIEADGRLCDVIRSNEDVVYDSKVGRLVSNKNERHGNFPSSKLQVFICEIAAYTICVNAYRILNITLPSFISIQILSYRKFNASRNSMYVAYSINT